MYSKFTKLKCPERRNPFLYYPLPGPLWPTWKWHQMNSPNSRPMSCAQHYFFFDKVYSLPTTFLFESLLICRIPCLDIDVLMSCVVRIISYDFKAFLFNPTALQDGEIDQTYQAPTCISSYGNGSRPNGQKEAFSPLMHALTVSMANFVAQCWLIFVSMFQQTIYKAVFSSNQDVENRCT